MAKADALRLAALEDGSDDPRPYIQEAAPAYGPEDTPSWCGIFVRCMWQRAELEVLPWAIGSANLGYLTRTSFPEPGDLVAFKGRLGHQALFDRFDEDGRSLWTWDGNTTDAAGNPGRVAHRKRPKSEVLTYYRAPAERASHGSSMSHGPAPAPTPEPGQQVAALGIDVSAYQDPKRVDYARLAELGYTFGWVRGVKMGREIDTRCVEHVGRMRDAEFQVGLYGFFVPTRGVEEQDDLMQAALLKCSLGAGDLVPVLDVEGYSSKPASPAWVEPAWELLKRWEHRYGHAIRYHNVNDWLLMGEPDLLAEFDLWLADYTPPADLRCLVWQIRSAAVPGYGSSLKLDQNVAHGPLPTIVTAGEKPIVRVVRRPPIPTFDLRSTVESRRKAREEYLAKFPTTPPNPERVS